MTRFREFRRIAVVGLMFVLVSAVSLSPARASVPTGTPPPTFGNPLNITNRYQPFQPGGVKVYRGTKGKTRQVVVDLYRTDTRTFRLNSRNVECRILQEIAFENGQLVESSLNFFAQADDGTVYYLARSWTSSRTASSPAMKGVGSSVAPRALIRPKLPRLQSRPSSCRPIPSSATSSSRKTCPRSWTRPMRSSASV